MERTLLDTLILVRSLEEKYDIVLELTKEFLTYIKTTNIKTIIKEIKSFKPANIDYQMLCEKFFT